MANSGSEIRRRVTTLYPLSNEDKQKAEESSQREKSTCDTKAGIAGQINDVAEFMFREMCQGLGCEVITKDDIDGAIQRLFINSVNPTRSLFQSQVYAQSTEVTKSAIKKLLLDAVRSSPTQQITCAVFCDTAVRYSRGDLPLFRMQSSADEKDYKAKEANLGGVEGSEDGKIHFFKDDRVATSAVPAIAKATRKLLEESDSSGLFRSPLYTLTLLYHDSLRWIERQGVKWLWSSFSTKQAYWLIAAYLLPLMTIPFIISSISTALFAGAMIAMVLITLQIAINYDKLQLKQEYLSLFQHFNKLGSKIVTKPSRLDVVHYANFIAALIVAVFSLEFSYLHPALYSLLMIISATVMVLVTLQYDLYERRFFQLFLIAKIAMFFIAVLAKISNYIPLSQGLLNLQVAFQIPLTHGFFLKISILSLLQVLFHVYLLVLWLRKVDWDTFHSSLGPLSLSLCWFALSKHFMGNSSSEYILSIIVVCACLTFMVSLLPIVFLASPWVFLFYFGLTAPFYYSCGFVAGATFMFLVLALIWKYLPSFWMNLSLDYVFLLAVAITIPLLLYLSAWNMSMYQSPQLPLVSVEEYDKYCGPRNWNINSVQTQINCLHLEGRVLGAEGMVKHVSVSKTVNSMEDSIKFLPTFFQRSLTCVLGGTRPLCGDLVDASTCYYNGCHFHSSLQYTFEIKLHLQNTRGRLVSFKLIVSDRYRDVVTKLEENSELKFNATFLSGMGTDTVTLQALSLKVAGTPDQHHLEEEKEREMHQHLLHGFFKSLMKTASLVADVFLGLDYEINM